RRDRLLLIERRFENQKVSTAREPCDRFIKSCVGCVDNGCAALVRQLDCQTLWPMRGSQKTRFEPRQNLNRFVCLVASYFFEFERKLQLEEPVVVRLVNRFYQFFDTRAGKNL